MSPVPAPNNKRQELGQYLRKLLSRNKLKQSDLAKFLGVSRQYVSLLVNGLTAMSAEHFKQIRSWFFRYKLPSQEIDGFIQRYIESKINLQQDLPPTSDDIYQVVQELKKYVNQELVLNRCLELASGESDYSEAIQQILPTVAEAVSGDYSCIYIYDDHYKAAQIIFEWQKSGEYAPWVADRRIATPSDSTWQKQITQRQVIHIESGNAVKQLPECLRKIYQESPLNSMLLCGVWRHQELFGMFMLANRNTAYVFNEHDERLCMSVSRIIQLLLERG